MEFKIEKKANQLNTWHDLPLCLPFFLSNLSKYFCTYKHYTYGNIQTRCQLTKTMWFFNRKEEELNIVYSISICNSTITNCFVFIQSEIKWVNFWYRLSLTTLHPSKSCKFRIMKNLIRNKYAWVRRTIQIQWSLNSMNEKYLFVFHIHRSEWERRLRSL